MPPTGSCPAIRKRLLLSGKTFRLTNIRVDTSHEVSALLSILQIHTTSLIIYLASDKTKRYVILRETHLLPHFAQNSGRLLKFRIYIA